MEWRPIESAPKDGTHLLLYGRIEWEDYGDEGDPPEIVVGYYDVDEWDFKEGWVLVNANPYTDFCHPTHWMPRPAPPEQNENET